MAYKRYHIMPAVINHCTSHSCMFEKTKEIQIKARLDRIQIFLDWQPTDTNT